MRETAMRVLLWTLAGLVFMYAGGNPADAQQVPSAPGTMSSNPLEVPTGIPSMPEAAPTWSVPSNPTMPSNPPVGTAATSPSQPMVAVDSGAPDPVVCDDLARAFFSLPKESRISYASTLHACIEDSVR